MGINRQGVDTSKIMPGDYIVYQIGVDQRHPAIAKVVSCNQAYSSSRTAFKIASDKVIAPDYVLATFKDYKPPYQAPYQSPEEVAYITAARANGKTIYCRMKIEGHEWQECKGSFQFNFSSCEYKVGE